MPAPTAVKIRNGEPHLDRVNRAEPKPRPGTPPIPEDLDPTARAVWQAAVEDLPEGLLSRVDGPILRCYVDAASRYLQAAALLAASGPLVRGARAGELVKNPLHQVVRDNADAVRLFARELGLSPAARAGLHVEYSHTLGSLEDEIGLPPRLRVVGDGRG